MTAIRDLPKVANCLVSRLPGGRGFGSMENYDRAHDSQGKSTELNSAGYESSHH